MRLSNSSYASSSRNTTSAVVWLLASAASTAGTIVSTMPRNGSTSATAPKAAKASAFGTRQAVSRTKMNTPMDRQVMACPRR